MLGVLLSLVTPVISTAPAPPPLRVEFLPSINDEKSPLVRGYAKHDAIFVRVPRRFFESGDVCSISGCSVICASLLGSANVEPVIATIEQQEQQELDRKAAHDAAPGGSAKPRPFKLKCRGKWTDSRGIGGIPGVETDWRSMSGRENHDKQKHLPAPQFYHSFSRTSVRLRRWDSARGVFVAINPRLVQTAGYPLNYGELAGLLGPGTERYLSYMHAFFSADAEVAMAVGAPQLVSAAMGKAGQIGLPVVDVSARVRCIVVANL